MTTLERSSALVGRAQCQDALVQLLARFSAGAEIVRISEGPEAIGITVVSGEDIDTFDFAVGTLPANALLELRSLAT